MFLKEFFYLQKSDRKVVLVFLSVVVISLLIIFVVGGRNDKTADNLSDSSSYDRNIRSSADSKGSYYIDGKRAELFTFDPNTADSTALLKLGLQPWQVRNIYKYRAAGGIYRSPEDFARLYGLTVKQYREMRPYIRISPDYSPAANIYSDNSHLADDYKKEPFQRDTVKYPLKLKAHECISLNLSDTTALKRVPGIGSGYARAIVRYREQLGGFYRVEQLREIEGFPEEAMKHFTIVSGSIQKININKLTLSQLRRHPYINFFQAKDILDYRRLRGSIHSLQDLRLLKDFPPSEIERLQPYVEF
ncbi:MAG TPA: helix-hairpin-helix domain-containing protein [Xylanibacter oryzae]|nr:helix-hairpin-helix domain-containing protein [Xylanibacter oryzae]